MGHRKTNYQEGLTIFRQTLAPNCQYYIIQEKNHPLKYYNCVEKNSIDFWFVYSSIHYLAVRAIQKIGDKSAIPFLKEIANDKNEHEKVRKAVEMLIEVLSK